MMHDFTLVIPTYNRSQLLAALLRYLEAQNADCPVLVLDSSSPEELAANRERAAASSLDLEFAEFPDWSRAKSGVRAFEKSERRSAACARTMTSSFSKACGIASSASGAISRLRWCRDILSLSCHGPMATWN